jgi:hypothetical protein
MHVPLRPSTMLYWLTKNVSDFGIAMSFLLCMEPLQHARRGSTMGYIFIFYVDGSFTVRIEYLSPCQFRCAVSLEMLFNRYEPNLACGSLFVSAVLVWCSTIYRTGL